MIGLVASAVLIASNGDDVATVDVPEGHAIGKLDKPVAPYKAARIYWTGDSETTPSNECHLAIQTEHGWTVAPLDLDCWGNGRYYRRLEVRELLVKSSLLWLRYQASSSDPDEDGAEEADYVVMCGLADGAPRCTAPVQVSFARGGKAKWKVNAALKAGALVLSLAQGKRAALPEETAALLGKHAISFQ
jgi:hypothetical protein